MTLEDPAVAHAPPDLESWLAARVGGPLDRVSAAVAGLAAASARIVGSMSRGPLPAVTPSHDRADRAENNRQTSLYSEFGREILAGLADTGVAYLASKDEDAIITLDPSGGLAIAVAPIGGSGDICANGPAGTLFAIFPVSPDGAAASFLRPGDDLLAAGYIIHGVHTALVLTACDGVAVFVLDPAGGVFRLSGSDHRMAAQARDLAIDMSNYRFWHHPVRLLVDDCMAGADGPRGADYTFRWTACLVADAHRILTTGGVFIDPADHRTGRQSGGARLVFEAFAVALVMEQAGGAASDTHRRILSRTASDMSQRTPLVFGSAAGVKLVNDYHLGPAARVSDGALFGRRGLYRK